MVTSDEALAIGVNLLFAIHRLSIPEEIRFYLGLGFDLGFLNYWEEKGEQLTLTFYDGTPMSFEIHASSTCDFLKEQVEFFVDAICPSDYSRKHLYG